MAKSNDTLLQDILKDIKNGSTRLPDFQMGWVWDDERIRALIASITSSYPVGAVMLLEYVGDGIRFKSRPFTNVPDDGKTPESLVLDGQQRLTSVYCSLFSKSPVPMQTIKKESIQRYYYLDIIKCLDPDIDRVDAVVSVPPDKKIKEDFGRVVVKDLSTREGEFKEQMFPLNIVFDSIVLDEMKPKKSPNQDLQANLFLVELTRIINLDHPLAKLADAIEPFSAPFLKAGGLTGHRRRLGNAKTDFFRDDYIPFPARDYAVSGRTLSC